MRDRRSEKPTPAPQQPPASPQSGLRATALCIIILLTATFMAHAGGLRNGFVNWDDDYVIVDNEAYRGLSPTQLRWMFTTSHAGHYQPLTWLSLAIDHAAWGEVSAFGIHLTNLILHALTAVGFWLIAQELLRRAKPLAHSRDILFGTTVAALLFAVHPLRVESVAWATERRDVLSGLFLMVTLYAYLRAVNALATRRAIWLTLSISCYLLSLFSKAVGMTLPVILLLLDYYPLRRWPTTDSSRTKAITALLIEKIPFALPALLFAILAAWAQRDAGAMWDTSAHPALLRIMQAFYGIMFYPFKTLWPFGLIPLYEQPTDIGPFAPPYLVAMIAVIAISAMLIVKRKIFTPLTVAWFAYVVMVSPMLGFAQSGPQVVADRYSYIPCLALALLAGGAVSAVAVMENRSRNRARILTLSGLTLLILLLILLTRKQTAVWADSASLWTHTITVAPRTGVAHGNLASIFNRRGEFNRAKQHSLIALDILPGNRVAHLTLARAALGLGDLPTAEKHYEIGLSIRPDDPGPLIQLAGVKLDLGKIDEAERLCRRLMEVDPRQAQWPFMLATVLSRAGRDEEAAAQLLHALSLDPSHVDARLRASQLLARQGDRQASLQLMDAGARQFPQDVRLLARLAWLLATCPDDHLRDGPRALDLAQRAIAYDPQFPPAHEALAAAQAETGDLVAAAEKLEKALTNPQLALGGSLRQRWSQHLQTLRVGMPLRE